MRYTEPPVLAPVLYVDELGPVTPYTVPPALSWSHDGHRIKAPLEYSRSLDNVWGYGALRVKDGQALTLTASSRHTEATCACSMSSTRPIQPALCTCSPIILPAIPAILFMSGLRA